MTPGRYSPQKVDSSLRSSGAPEDVIALCSVAFERVIVARVLHEARDFCAEEVKQDLYDQMYPALELAEQKNPRVLVADDLHWTDPASTAMLTHLLSLANHVPIVFICVFRPEEQIAAWELRERARTEFADRYTEIVLNRLDEGETDELVSSLLNISDLPAELRKLVLRKSDGNPCLEIEKIVRTLVENGAVIETAARMQWNAETDLSQITIPDPLQALLIARMDRLDQETRATLRPASVIARTFYYNILEAISESAIHLDKRLFSLERVELLRQVGDDPGLECVFKHGLARDVAYGTTLNGRRRDFHRRVGEAMESSFEQRLDENAHRLAQHFSLAGNEEKALRYFIMAGEVAAGLSVQGEVARHFDRALEAAQHLQLADNERECLRQRRTAALVYRPRAADSELACC